MPDPKDLTTMPGAAYSKAFDTRPVLAAESRDVLVMRIHPNQESTSCRFFSEVFGALQTWKLSIIFLVTRRSDIYLAVDANLGDGMKKEDKFVTLNTYPYVSIRNLETVGIVEFVPDMVSIKLTLLSTAYYYATKHMLALLERRDVHADMIIKGMSLASRGDMKHTEKCQVPMIISPLLLLPFAIKTWHFQRYTQSFTSSAYHECTLGISS